MNSGIVQDTESMEDHLKIASTKLDAVAVVAVFIQKAILLLTQQNMKKKYPEDKSR